MTHNLGLQERECGSILEALAVPRVAAYYGNPFAPTHHRLPLLQSKGFG